MALKLTKEMEERKVPSFSRTYVPNRYTVYLCPQDREHYRSYEGALAQELAEHVERHAQGANLVLVGPPRVRFKTDSDLKRGQFGIQAEMAEGEVLAAADQAEAQASQRGSEPAVPKASTEEVFHWEPEPAASAEAPAAPLAVAAPKPPGSAVEPGVRVPFFPGPEDSLVARPEPEREAEPPVQPPGSQTESIPAGVAAAMGLARQTLVLQLHGRRVEFEKGRVVLGRGRQVDLQLEDPNVSRRHAVIYWENGRLFVKDLGSTNGTLLNGRPVKSGPLSRGDVISVGGNEIRVETG
jgi:predicted component of type VI protein secretion system